MPILSIEITDDVLKRLDDLARSRGQAPVDLVRGEVERLVEDHGTRVAEAAARVLVKNDELYRRLAR